MGTPQSNLWTRLNRPIHLGARSLDPFGLLAGVDDREREERACLVASLMLGLSSLAVGLGVMAVIAITADNIHLFHLAAERDQWSKSLVQVGWDRMVVASFLSVSTAAVMAMLLASIQLLRSRRTGAFSELRGNPLVWPGFTMMGCAWIALAIGVAGLAVARNIRWLLLTGDALVVVALLVLGLAIREHLGPKLRLRSWRAWTEGGLFLIVYFFAIQPLLAGNGIVANGLEKVIIGGVPGIR